MPSFPRSTCRILMALFVCLVAVCFASASAQTSPTQGYAGYTLHLQFSGTPGKTRGSFSQKGDWLIYGPNSSSAVAASSSAANGWTVSQQGVTNNVGLSLSAAPGNYISEYCTGVQSTFDKSIGENVDTYIYQAVGFTVVATPPTLPPLGNPAFSWQGSVAGVNTGNGNKTTTVPITGWTMRGGMPVSCALYHNSQGPQYGGYGNKWLVSYFTYLSASGSNLVIHWDNGLSYMFTANSDGTWSAPIGILDKLSYTNGVYKLTTPGQTVYTFGYGSGPVYLSSIQDKDGNTLSIGHNSDTTISTVSDPNGRTLTYTYSGGHLVSVTDPLNRAWTIAYNTIGGSNGNNVWYVALPPLNGQTYASWFGYDGNNNITSTHSPQGHVTNATSTFGYDGAGRLLWAQDPLGSRTTFTYNADNTVITDPNGHTTKHTYAYSQLRSVTDALTDALGNTSYSNYDVDNILSSTKDKRGNTWSSSSHFSNGTSTSTSTTPLGFSSSATYSADGKNKVVHSVDALNNATDNTYSTDGKDDLLTTSITGTGSASFKATSKVGGYANGLPTTFTDPLGFPSSVGYDTYGNVTSATDANNNTSTSVPSLLGWKMSSTDANNHTTTNTYDTWGRVTDVQAADNAHTKMTYDLNGNVLTVTDANNHTVTNTYDADDRLTQTVKGNGDIVSYTYDGTDIITGATQRGLLSSKTDGNNHTTSYTYTARNEPSATYYADGTHESVAYDPNGNTISRTKADGKVIRYAYDKDNRLTDITYPTLPAVHFDYDAGGRKTHMHDGTGDTYWDYTYDGVHLTAQTTPQGTVYYGFDADGRRSLRQLVGTGYWNYAYDNGGRLKTLSSPKDGTTTYNYDAANRLTQKTKGNGEYETYAYDVANQVTGIGFFWADTTYRNGLTYTYDPAGNVKVCDQGYYNTTYAYDGADQLTGETSGGTYPPPNRGFSYDKNSNRLTQSQNGVQSQSFTYDAHDKLVSGTAGNETDGYDLNGNTTSVSINGGTYRDAYDDEDRLISVTPPGYTSPLDTYTYNGLGLRVGKVDSTGTYSYICDGTSPGSPVLSDSHAVYTPGLSENRGGTSAFYNFDRLGNLWTLDGSSKSQLGYVDYSGFGGTVAGGASSPFGFGGGNGCQTESDTGIVLMGHRYYDSRIGRFLTQDPAKAGGNWYSYAGNNPVNKTDPSGLVPMDGPGSSPMGSPGYAGISSSAGVANNQEFSDTVAYNQRQGQINAAFGAQMMFSAAGQALLNAMPVIAPQINDLTGSASYGVSISLGRVRFTGAVGVAYDFYTGKLEFFRQYGGFVGAGKGLSSGLGFTLGNDTLGNFGGFNGPSINLDYLTSSHGVFGIEANRNYGGIEFSPPGIGPLRYTQFGNENGIFGGATNTVPFGPSYTLKFRP